VNTKKKIGIVGGGVQLGPLDTAATNRPIVPASGDYDDGGMMIGRGNQVLKENLPQCSFVHHKPHMLPGLLWWDSEHKDRKGSYSDHVIRKEGSEMCVSNQEVMKGGDDIF
jgi:hypothetical protein